MIIEGETGSAKSSLALLLAQAIQDHPFKVKDQVFWRPDGVIKAARDLPEFSAIILDEAVSVNRRKAMHGGNVDMMEHLNVCRTFHHVVVFCIPQLEDLDISIQTRASWVFSCSKHPRGLAVCHQVTNKTRKWIVPTARFEDRYQDPSIKYPELWQDYLDGKKAFSHQGDDPKEPLRDATIEAYRKIIREVIDGQDDPFFDVEAARSRGDDEA